MSVQTVLLDFSIEIEKIANDCLRKDVTLCMIKILQEKYFPNLQIIYDIVTSDGYLCLLTEDNVTYITIRFFTQTGLITLNIEYFKKNDETPKINFDVRFSYLKLNLK